MVHGHCHLLCVFRYLNKEISDESILMVWDSIKLKNLVRLSFRLLMDPYPYLLEWGVSAHTPDGCHRLRERLDWAESHVCVLCCVFSSLFIYLFFFCSNRTIWPSQSWTVYGCIVHGFHKFHFSAIFSLKMGPTALFTHLKIISLQCFQFQFSISAKISLIQTDHKLQIIRGWALGF